MSAGKGCRRFDTGAVLGLLLLVAQGTGFGCPETSAFQERPTREELYKDMVVEEITDSVFLFTHFFPWGNNGLLVTLGDRYLVMIDTPCEPMATEILLKWIHYKFRKRLIVAVNTGWQIDQLGGNQVLIEQGIKVYGSSQTRRLVEAYGESYRGEMVRYFRQEGYLDVAEKLSKMNLVGPTETYPAYKGLTISQGGESIRVFFPGAGATSDNQVVYVPKAALLFGGNLVRSLDNIRIGPVEETYLGQWPDSLREIEKTFPHTRVVVPGHGQWGGMALIPHTRQMVLRGAILHKRH